MKKILFALIIAVSVGTVTVAQTVLKENVPIVKSNYSDTSKEFLQNLANRVRRNGYRSAADQLEAITKGGFGSGFLYIDSHSEKYYIITNRHVVSQATSASLEFTHSDKEIKFNDCTIIAIDEELDLALIELPENHSFIIGKGLNVISKRKEEGTEVFSAGFPGLNGSPSWQLGKGIISNSSVKNDMFSGTNKIAAIQHTAPIDPGSSGGPLTVKENDQYKVIGVNTWGVSNRENAYFAISGEAINQFLSKYINKTYNSNADLERRANELLETLGKNYAEATQYISDEYVETVSTNNFFEIVINVPDSVEKKMEHYFNKGYPIDAVRHGLSYFLYKQQDKNEVKFVRIEADENTNEKKVILSSRDKEFNTYWIYSLGEWRLKDYTQLKLKNLEDNGISENFNLDRILKLGYETGNNSRGYTFESERFANSYLSLGWRIAYREIDMKYKDFDKDGTEFFSTKQENSFLLDYQATGYLPIKLGSVYILPNAKIALGVGFIDDTAPLTYTLGGGVSVAYKINQTLSVLLGTSYNNINLKSKELYYLKSINAIQIHAGVAF